MTAAALPVADGELVLPEPIGKQYEWMDSPATRKVLRVGRRGTKTRFAFMAGLMGHGRGWEDQTPSMPGVLQGGDVVWLSPTYSNLTTVLWREEIVPRMSHLPWVNLNVSLHDVNIPGLGSLMLRSGDREAINSIRGVGNRLRGVIVDEAAHMDLRGALQDVILPACLDNNAWLIIMSTTNAGKDGGYDDQGAPQVPSYFNQICEQIRAGQRSHDWEEFYATAFDNPTLDTKAINELIAEYPPDSPKLKQEVFAELLKAGVGLALPKLSAERHLVPRFPVPEHWHQFGAFDWGFNHPWVFGWYCADEDGNVIAVDTLWGREDLPDEIGRTISHAVPVSNKRFVIHAGPDIFMKKGAAVGFQGPTIAEALATWGLKLIPANNSRVLGLNNLRAYTHWDESWPVERKPRFTMMDTEGNRRCLAQMQTMQIDPTDTEDALKVDADAAGRGGDDGYDQCLRGDTLIETTRGAIPISALVGTTGYVHTPSGTRRFYAVRQTRERAGLFRVRFADGRYVEATANHPFLTTTGWVQVDKLIVGDLCVDIAHLIRYIPLHGQSNGNFRNSSGVRGSEVLADEGRVLSSSQQVAFAGSVAGCEWGDSTEAPCSPLGWEQGEQSARQSHGDGWDGASAWSLAGGETSSGSTADAREGAEDSGHGEGLASFRSRKAGALSHSKSNVGSQSVPCTNLPAVRQAVQHASFARTVEVLPPKLQGEGATRSSARIEGIQELGFAPVYNMEVEDAHCFAVAGGLVVHNCRYGLMSRPILAVAPPMPDRENVSMGYDYKANKPRERETGEEFMSKLLNAGKSTATAGRYRVPTRRSR